MNEEEKEAVKYFYNLRATIDESNMLFGEDINVKCGKEMIKQITIVLNLLEKKDKESHFIQSELDIANAKIIKLNNIVDEIQKEVRDHIGFENRLKRDNIEPDLFNQGRFYVANNINNILKGK